MAPLPPPSHEGDHTPNAAPNAATVVTYHRHVRHAHTQSFIDPEVQVEVQLRGATPRNNREVQSRGTTPRYNPEVQFRGTTPRCNPRYNSEVQLVVGDINKISMSCTTKMERTESTRNDTAMSAAILWAQYHGFTPRLNTITSITPAIAFQALQARQVDLAAHPADDHMWPSEKPDDPLWCLMLSTFMPSIFSETDMSVSLYVLRLSRATCSEMRSVCSDRA